MANESDIPERIANVLLADSTLTALLSDTSAIYENAAPEGTQFPFVVYFFMGGPGDMNKFSGQHVDIQYTVKAVARDGNEASTILARVDALLHGQEDSLTNGDWKFVWARRNQYFGFHETDHTGRPVAHVGSIFRFRAHSVV